MTEFRVHFEGGEKVTVPASTPADARAVAKERRPDEIILKIKRVKENGNG